MAERLRIATKLERKAKVLLHDEGLEPGSVIMADKIPPGAAGRGDLVLSTNVYGLGTKEVAIYMYHVSIVGLTRSDKEVKFTDSARGDALVVNRRGQCRDVFLAFKAGNGAFLDGNLLYYDLQSILYSTNELNVDKGDGSKFVIPREQLPQEFDGAFISCALTIKRVTENFKLTLNDLSKANSNLDLTDQSLQQFLNLATSQHMLFSPHEHITFSSSNSYLLNPEAHGFRAEDAPVFADNSSYLAIGAQKGVRFVEGPNGYGNTKVGIVIETKKTPFHLIENVLKKASCIVRDLSRPMQNNELDKLGKLLKGLQVDTIHGSRPRSFVVKALSSQTANSKTVNYNERDIPISQYFAERYNIVLTHPHLPLLEEGAGGRKNHYPMELCYVSDNQRVKGMQQTPRQVQEMIRKCAVTPFVLRHQNQLTTESLHLTNNEYLNNAHIKFVPTSLAVNARILQCPALSYAGSEMSKPRDDTLTWQGKKFLIPSRCGKLRDDTLTWLGKKFLIPSGCGKWAAYAFCGAGRDSLNENELRDFIGIFVTEARFRGMNLPDPDAVLIRRSDPKTMEMEIVQAAKNEVEYVLMAHPDSADDMHHQMKLSERYKDIITQGLKITTIRNVLQKGQPLTVQNIVQKTNLKMGGLNYSLAMNSSIANEVLGSDTLYIGFGVNHPAGGMGKKDDEKNGSDNGNGNGRANGNGHPNGNGHQNGNGHPNGNGHRNGNGHANGNGHLNGNGAKNNSGSGSRDSADESGSTGSEIVGNNPVSVIGFSANVGVSHNFEFIGDFIYQMAKRDEKSSIIRDVIKRCVEKYNGHRGKYPKRLIIYRNGTSEGQYPMILKYEVPLIIAELASLGCDAKVTLIVSNKLQNVRFFCKDIDSRARAPDQNIRAGTVVDTGVVHPFFTEFFLNSHRALQGTARTPRYTVLFDGNKLSADQLQGITYHLCFGHQIVYMPTSLPSPVYIANRYAERGRNMYSRFNVVNTSDNTGQSFQDLTDRLSYQHTEYLKDLRINA